LASLAWRPRVQRRAAPRSGPDDRCARGPLAGPAAGVAEQPLGPDPPGAPPCGTWACRRHRRATPRHTPHPTRVL